MIELQAALLCNAAQLDLGTGLVSMLGAFADSIAAPQLPIPAQLWFVARLSADPNDVGEPHTMTLTVEHSDGTEVVARIEGSAVPAGPLPNYDPDLPIGIPLVVPLPLEFRRQGVYLVTLTVDGERRWQSRIKVKTTFPQL